MTIILSKFYAGFWELTRQTVERLAICKDIKQWAEMLDKTVSQGRERGLQEIHDIIASDANTSLTKTEMFHIVELIKKLGPKSEIISNASRIPNVDETVFRTMMKSWCSELRRKASQLDPCMPDCYQQWLLESLELIDYVILRFLKYRLRNTQKVAILSNFRAKHDSPKENILVQVKTGEGKTCIVLAVAIIRGLLGQRTDIVTSSGMLAKRDATAYTKLYEAFGLSVGDVTVEDQTNRSAHYLKTVVYGEVGDFQRDYLMDHFYGQNIRGDRPFENIVIDEVDSMFLDKGNSVLYLSHVPPELYSLENLFVFIWTRVLNSLNQNNFKPVNIYNEVLSSLRPVLELEDLNLLQVNDIERLYDDLIEQQVVTEEGDLTCNSLKNLDYLSDKYKKIATDLRKLISWKQSSVQPGMSTMEFLKPFVELHLFSWIKSAFQATRMKEGVEYVLDTDRLSERSEKHAKITILDLDTGTDQRGTQWSEALHQFLQLKHGCKLSPLSLKAVFISNISFFNIYKRIYGLSGTLGTESDRDFLKQVYKAEILVVPTALPRRFTEQSSIVCLDEAEWGDRIKRDILEKLSAGRSILALCETVRDAEALYKHITKGPPLGTKPEVRLYRRDYEPFCFSEHEQHLPSNQVIVATNLAGRGTDIKLSPQLIQAGGLHVIFTYLPSNARIGWQGFGRAGRCGDSGSGRLIFLGKKPTPATNAIDLIAERDHLEALRVADINRFYESVIVSQERMFRKFQEIFERFSNSLSDAHKTWLQYITKTKRSEAGHSKLLEGNLGEVKELLKYSMLNEWAFWLDSYSQHLTFSQRNQSDLVTKNQGNYPNKMAENVLLSKFSDNMNKYEEQFSRHGKTAWFNFLRDNSDFLDQVAEAVLEQPGAIIQMGKIHAKNKNYDKALQYFDKVMRNEALCHCAPAKYYSILCLLRKGQGKTENFKEHVRVCITTFNKLISQNIWFSNSIKTLGNLVRDQAVVSMEGYKTQKENTARILQIAKEALEDLIPRQNIALQNFMTSHDPSLTQQLYNFLQDEGIFSHLVLNFNADSLLHKKATRDFGLTFGIPETQLQSILLNPDFQGKLDSNKLKLIKRSINLPSRKGFWKEIEVALENCTTLAVYLENPLSQLTKFNNNIKDPWSDSHMEKGRLIVAKNNSVLQDAAQVIQAEKKFLKCDPRFFHFKRQGLARLDQVGFVNLDKLKRANLESYTKVCAQDFTLIKGITETRANKIFCSLAHAGVICEVTGKLLKPEILHCSGFPLENILEVYRQDIIAVVKTRCSYQYELLKMIEHFETVSKQPNCGYQQYLISLPADPFKNFIAAAMDIKILQNTSVNYEQVKKTFVDSKYEEMASIKLDDIQILFPTFTESQVHEIWEHLQQTNWIDSGGRILLDSIENRDWEEEVESNEIYNVNEEVGTVTREVFYDYCLPSIQPFIFFRIKFSKDEEFQQEVKKTLTSFAGQLAKLENPDGVLTDLQDHLYPILGEHIVDYTDELHAIHTLGFDRLISPTEQLYSKKMIGSTLAVLANGVSQVALGTWLTPASGGLAGYLSMSGRSDIIYGLKAFYSGSFRWGDWSSQKATSLVLDAVAFKLASQTKTWMPQMNGIAPFTNPSNNAIMMQRFLHGVTTQVLLQYCSNEFFSNVGIQLTCSVREGLGRVSSYFLGGVGKMIEHDLLLQETLSELAHWRNFDKIWSTCLEEAIKSKVWNESSKHAIARFAAATFKMVIKPTMRYAFKSVNIENKALFSSIAVFQATITLTEVRDAMDCFSHITTVLVRLLQQEMEDRPQNRLAEVETEKIERLTRYFKKELLQTLHFQISELITVNMVEPLICRAVYKLTAYTDRLQNEFSNNTLSDEATRNILANDQSQHEMESSEAVMTYNQYSKLYGTDRRVGSKRTFKAQKILTNRKISQYMLK